MSAVEKTASERLMAELEQCMDSTCAREGFEVEVGENLFEWTVRLHSFEDPALLEGLLLFADATGQDPVVTLNIAFPPDFPHRPPFVRVISPRFHQYTAHIVDGAICVQDLSSSGWQSTNSVFQIIVMVRNLLVEGHALVSLDILEPYSLEDARASFSRVMLAHGWEQQQAPGDADADQSEAVEEDE